MPFWDKIISTKNRFIRRNKNKENNCQIHNNFQYFTETESIICFINPEETLFTNNQDEPDCPNNKAFNNDNSTC